MINSLLYVFLGGGIGSILRYALGTWLNPEIKNEFPTGTFVTNILSCIIVGFLAGLISKNIIDEKLRLLLMTGFCGGFSTFSTYILEINKIAEGQNHSMVIIYAVSSVILGWVACVIGLWGSHQI